MRKFELLVTFLISLCVFCGYAIYGVHCLNLRGDFFAPFADQRYWNKTLGIHLELLFYPRSLLFDFLALYYPFILLTIAVFISLSFTLNQNFNIFIAANPYWNVLIIYPPALIVLYLGRLVYIINRIKTIGNSAYQKYLEPLVNLPVGDCLSGNYLFWFSSYFVLFHSVIVFFTQDRLYSLARYVFSLPFFFLSLGYICLSLNRKFITVVYTFIIISVFSSIIQWIDYGRNSWLG